MPNLMITGNFYLLVETNFIPLAQNDKEPREAELIKFLSEYIFTFLQVIDLQ